MSYNAKNYVKQGGDTTVIGGTLEFKEGSSVVNDPGGGGGSVPVASEDTVGVVKVSPRFLTVGEDGTVLIRTLQDNIFWGLYIDMGLGQICSYVTKQMDNIPETDADFDHLESTLAAIIAGLKDCGAMQDSSQE